MPLYYMYFFTVPWILNPAFFFFCTVTKSQISIGSSTSLALILQNKVCLVLLSNRSWKSILCIVSNYPCSFKKMKCLWQYWNVFLVFLCSVVSWNLRCSAIPRKCNKVAMFPSWSVKKIFIHDSDCMHVWTLKLWFIKQHHFVYLVLSWNIC